ncbi:MAG TPA: AAA family ATPase [Candidatus Acidoferrales bacterium]|nr:AAA family ATPase [Candidatus Acidoferrales bacterium]
MNETTRSQGLYAKHFGLTGEPFSAAPNPQSLHLGPQHADVRAALEIGLRQRSGLLVVTGEPGTGKTSLLYSVLSELGPEIETAYVANTSISFDDLLSEILADLGIAASDRGRAAMLRQLNEFLRRCAEERRLVAVVVDEAQNLSLEALENIRLLSNFETFENKLLQIVLVGQPELDIKLASPQLRQLANRIAVRCQLNPLSPVESERYVEHRLGLVGGSTDLFTPAARRTLLRQSRGVPRRINILCQTALLFAFGQGASRVSWALARRTVQRLAALEHERGTLEAAAELTPARLRTAAETLSMVLAVAGLGALILLAVGLIERGRQPSAAATAIESHAVAGKFPTTLDVDTGTAPQPRLAVETHVVDPSANPQQAWPASLLTLITVGLAIASGAMLLRLRRVRSGVWSMA